jgi:myosin heavy subunit
MAVDIVTLAEALGSSGVSVLLWNLWNSKRIEKSARRAEERNEKREPLIEQSINLGNVVKVTELMRQGIQELEDSKQRLSDDMKTMQGRFEDRIIDLQNENDRIRREFLEQQTLDKETIKELLAEIELLKEKLSKINI